RPGRLLRAGVHPGRRGTGGCRLREGGARVLLRLLVEQVHPGRVRRPATGSLCHAGDNCGIRTTGYDLVGCDGLSSWLVGGHGALLVRGVGTADRGTDRTGDGKRFRPTVTPPGVTPGVPDPYGPVFRSPPRLPSQYHQRHAEPSGA